MRDILRTLTQWGPHGEAVALATVIETRASAPLRAGSAMAVSGSGAVAGSISGGCVEGAVYEQAQEVLAGGPPRTVRYGISDSDAFTVGLTCGGELDVFVERLDEQTLGAVTAAADAVAHQRPVAVATVVGGNGDVGAKLVVEPDTTHATLGNEGLDAAVADDARGMLALGQTGGRSYGPRGERRLDDVDVFIHSFAPPPRLYVFGAIDFAAAVARIGKFLGFHVTVCDAREAFTTRTRFPDADEVVVQWPHRYLPTAHVDERTVICVLTHDPKFDVPLLQVALRRPAAYIGAMGSRRTHDDRVQRLVTEGVTAAELSRLRSPIGLDLGARTPEETAVSIAAEWIQLRWGGSGGPLSETSGRIHDDRRVAGAPRG